MSLDAPHPIAVSPDRLRAAYLKTRSELLNRRVAAGHWIGELATSALATATAVSALTCAHRATATDESSTAHSLVSHGLHWLAAHQNPDGGWGDTDLSHSNVATTLLAVAAFHLTRTTNTYASQLEAAEQYLSRQPNGMDRWEALRQRYGRDRTFAIPIMTNCAIAGLVSWRNVQPLPFELACFPQWLYRFLQLPVVSYAIPALVAVGQARYFHSPPVNPVTRLLRSRCVAKSTRVLSKIQPASGGYLEAVPLTSFVVMSLASSGRGDHPVVRSGLEFLAKSVRSDGGWPIDTNLATWNTTLALNAFAGAGEDLAEHTCLDWLLSCQNTQVHPYTGAAPGGWGWSDLSGAVPDADDTPGALLALSAWSRSERCSGKDRRRIRDAAAAGIRWLTSLQNRDGGWPTFCRGWGKLPFDRSGPDLTAHAVRAMFAWRDLTDSSRAIQRGVNYLARTQRGDGSWIPLWFGNQDVPGEENPVYGTAKVLFAYRDLGMDESEPARRARAWLVGEQNLDGGWGGGPVHEDGGIERIRSSVEETSLATEALADSKEPCDARSHAAGLEWLVAAVDDDHYRSPSPIGFYFAKLWYYEQLYPIIFTASALGNALRRQPALFDRTSPCSRLMTDSTQPPPNQPFVKA